LLDTASREQHYIWPISLEMDISRQKQLIDSCRYSIKYSDIRWNIKPFFMKRIFTNSLFLIRKAKIRKKS
jgi:hypothetical protein